MRRRRAPYGAAATAIAQVVEAVRRRIVGASPAPFHALNQSRLARSGQTRPEFELQLMGHLLNRKLLSSCISVSSSRHASYCFGVVQYRSSFTTYFIFCLNSWPPHFFAIKWPHEKVKKTARGAFRPKKNSSNKRPPVVSKERNIGNRPRFSRFTGLLPMQLWE